MKTIEQACYEAVIAVERKLGHGTYFVAWDDLEDADRAIYARVSAEYSANPDMTAENGHAKWRAERRAAGWIAGPFRQMGVRGDDHEIRVPLQQIAMRRANMTPRECCEDEIAEARRNHDDECEFAKGQYRESCKANPDHEPRYKEAMLEAIAVAKDHMEKEIALSSAAESARGEESEMVMIHPALYPWKKLPFDQKRKFVAFHDAVRKYQKQ